MKETVEQLAKERRGYKFLAADGTSPYQHYKYNLKSKRVLITKLDKNKAVACGSGWNLATLKWIADNCLTLDGVIAECTIPDDAQIIVPHNSDGKFRTNKIKIVKVHKINSMYPVLKDIQKRLKKYRPVNPIQAEEMPPVDKLKTILSKVRAQVGDQVRAQVWAQVWAQVGDQVGAQVGDQAWAQVGARVWDQVRAQVGAQVRAQVWAQVGDQVRAQVGDQVRAQVWAQVVAQVYITAYHAIKEFFNIDYDHPAFDLIRLGVFVVKVLDVFKVFGRNGKFLGEYKEAKR